MMMHFRKHSFEEDLSRINELVVQRGKEILLEALAPKALTGGWRSKASLTAARVLALPDVPWRVSSGGFWARNAKGPPG
jgi:hypothetical protein